jgi:hypothetical protein
MAVRVDRGDKAAAKAPPLVEADVTSKVEAILDPLHPFPAAGSTELPIRLKNSSNQPIYGPITVEVEKITPDGAILNAANGKNGAGATFDYSPALGTFDSLAPGAISDGIVWKFRAPATASDFPKLKFKVKARVPGASGAAEQHQAQ